VKLQNLHPQTRWWLLLLGCALLGGLIVRGLTQTAYSGTALMYLGLPWLVALLLALVPQLDADESAESSGQHPIFRGSLIVMLGSSFLLGEGFLCVLLFLPIYLFVVAVMIFIFGMIKRRERPDSKLQPIHLSPLLIGLLALEGTHPDLSFERAGSVTVEHVTSLDRLQLWANVHQPMVLNHSSSSGLSKLFPQPYQIDIDSFELGEVHTVHYRYARWFWTNVHEGSLELKIDERSRNAISARVVENTSYLANYLDIQRIRLTFDGQPEEPTKVSIQIDYQRTLDPAWYFSPLITMALRDTASYLIQTHILQEHNYRG